MASFYSVTLSDFFSNDWPRGWGGGGKTRLKFPNLDCSTQLQGGNKILKNQGRFEYHPPKSTWACLVEGLNLVVTQEVLSIDHRPLVFD